MLKKDLEAQIKDIQKDIKLVACRENPNVSNIGFIYDIRDRFALLIEEVYSKEHNFYKYLAAITLTDNILDDCRNIEVLSLVIGQELSTNIVVNDLAYSSNELFSWLEGLIWLPEHKKDSTVILSELKYIAVLNFVYFIYGAEHKFYTTISKALDKFLIKVKAYKDFPRNMSNDDIYKEFAAEFKTLDQILGKLNSTLYQQRINLDSLVSLHKGTKIQNIWFPFTQKTA